MKPNIYLVLALASITLTAEAQTASPAVCPKYSPLAPGQSFTVTNQGTVTGSPASYTLTLTPPAGTAKDPLPVDWMQTDASTLAFTIPLSADGTYTIQRLRKMTGTGVAAKTEGVTDFFPQQLTVERPAIIAVSPAAAFQNQNRENSFAVLMRGLCPSGLPGPTSNIQLHMSDISTPAVCSASITKKCYTLTVDNPQQVTLIFKKLDPDIGYYSGKKSFYLTVEGLDTDPAALTLINTTSSMPITVAISGFALILLGTYFVLRSGRKAMSQRMNGKTYWLSTLFFDQQTNSYSLSKCQFYAWTAASVVAYLYLAASRSYVQGSAEFPEIPSGLPGILLASVGTVVLSTGITTAKGDKGAGDPDPNLSDFIATGGVVAADRLQFAVWTLVGIGTFLAIVFQSDPRNITDLPAIPTGFMQLMGISAAGYLGGKLARKAGPAIIAIVLTSSPGGRPRFQITGSGLSRSASFSIDDKPIFPDSILGKDDQPGLPEIVQLDPTVGDPDFARVLAFSISTEDFQEAWLGKDRKFTVTNPDSQKAVWSYQKFKLDRANSIVKFDTISIIGECLDSNLSVDGVTITVNKVAQIDTLKVVRTNDVKTSGAFEGKITKADGTATGLVVDDKIALTVTDEAGFVSKWEAKVT